MVIKYQIKFQSLTAGGQHRSMTLSIYDATATSTTATPIQLTGAASPFTTEESGESDYYEPLVTSSGNIRFIVEDESVIKSIMPTRATDRPVVLSDNADGSVLWMGFVSGESYSQPWEPVPYSMTLPVKGIMSMMSGVEFTQEDGFVSLASLAETISSYLPFPVKIFAPSSIPFDLNVTNDNFRSFLDKDERKDQSTANIFQTESIATVLENFCNYFGVSCHEWHGNLYLIAHDAATYHDKDGGTLSPAVFDLLGLGVMSASNKMGFSKMYRYVHGEFDTGSDGDDSKDVTELSDFTDFMTIRKSSAQFYIFEPADPVSLLVDVGDDYRVGYGKNSSSYIMPGVVGGILYRNGNAWFTKGGGGVTGSYVAADGYHPIVGARSKGGTDMMQICTPLKDNAVKHVFTIRNVEPVKILKGDHSLLNISMDIKSFGERYHKYFEQGFRNGYDTEADPYFDEVDNDKTYHINMSLRIGGYYLTVETVTETTGDPGKGSFTHTYKKSSWKETESSFEVPVVDGNIAMNFLNDDDDARTYIFTQDNGLMVALPDFLRNKFVDVEVGLWSGFPEKDKWEQEAMSKIPPIFKTIKEIYDATYFNMIFTNFKISIAYENGPESMGMDVDSNKYIVPNDNASTYKYQVASTITTRKGLQHGTGLALNADHTFCTTCYDQHGCERRAAFTAKQRATLAVTVANNADLKPCDSLKWHSNNFGILSQSVDWKNNENKLNLINLD